MFYLEEFEQNVVHKLKMMLDCVCFAEMTHEPLDEF